MKTCIASSFADLEDVEAFRQAKKRGLSDQAAFAVGDNGIGCWGDFTANPDRPACALPPEDWQPLGKRARGASVTVCRGSKQVTCELLDTMPHKRNIRNGAGIDLNPAACRLLGLVPPVMAQVSWEFTPPKKPKGQSLLSKILSFFSKNETARFFRYFNRNHSRDCRNR